MFSGKSGYASSSAFIKSSVNRAIVEAISREFRAALPWELLYADDLAVIEDNPIKRLNEWKDNDWVNMNTA